MLAPLVLSRRTLEASAKGMLKNSEDREDREIPTRGFQQPPMPHTPSPQRRNQRPKLRHAEYIVMEHTITRRRTNTDDRHGPHPWSTKMFPAAMGSTGDPSILGKTHRTMNSQTACYVSLACIGARRVHTWWECLLI